MKKKIAMLGILLMVVGLTGCATLPKKFIRKKKEPLHKAAAVYLQEEGAYQKQFSNDYYYKTHFTLWKSWQDDMVSNLTGNTKKLRRSAEEAYSHLDQMSRYLKPEKQAVLKQSVDELGAYRTKFEQGSYSRADANSMKTDLERIKREVANNFYYDKIKADLVEDVVSLE